MQKWEYYTLTETWEVVTKITLDKDSKLSQLLIDAGYLNHNEKLLSDKKKWFYSKDVIQYMGLQGWELVSAVPLSSTIGTTGITLFFKRPINIEQA